MQYWWQNRKSSSAWETDIKCSPIGQIPARFGQIPARFEVIKLRLFFLKYILNQNSESLIARFLQIQIEKSSKFDWVSTCLKDLKKLKIDISFEDIKNLPNNQFKNIIRKKCKEVALEYLLNKRGSKGKEIIYDKSSSLSGKETCG